MRTKPLQKYSSKSFLKYTWKAKFTGQDEVKKNEAIRTIYTMNEKMMKWVRKTKK